ncbi:prepilin peptidase [Luteipulveratus halotolerans]|uniref:prepilin peptidase n=1 Tax=Luteipulveratus halotolerans TaxID=1631356 RepID=UPI0006824AD4|nr:A24 family peptidase [Luteipulveratus halotolerans]
MIVETTTGAAAGLALGYAGLTRLRTGVYRYDDERDQPLRRFSWVPVAATVGAGLSAAAHTDEPLLAAVLAISAALLVVLSGIDIDVRRLPDRWTWPGAGAAAVATLGCALVAGDLGRWWGALACGTVLSLTYLTLAVVGDIALGEGSLGLGDVKLAMSLGVLLGYLGWELVLVGTFAAFLLASCYGVWLMVVHRKGREATMPFGPFMALGAVATWCLPVLGTF